MTQPIYLDYNATTPMDPRVLDAMLPYLTDTFGNAASIDHVYGSEASHAVEHAREHVADLIGAAPEEIIFTSGATEADNIAILGTLGKAPNDAEVIVSAIEHPAVLESAAHSGKSVRLLRVDEHGIVDPDELRTMITPKTALVSVMAANNETGALQPLEAIGATCAEAGVPFHTDAVQAAARTPLNVDAAHLALVSLSAHKAYGPKGVGALFVRRRGRRMKLAPLHHGGGHERNLRPGTANVPGIVGMGVAASLASAQRDTDAAREADLKAKLAAALAGAGGVEPNTALTGSLPQTLNLHVAGVGARALMHATRDRLAFSSGSACATTKAEPSLVLLAQGLSPGEASESIRLSFGRFTTPADLDVAAEVLSDAIAALRELSQRAA